MTTGEARAMRASASGGTLSRAKLIAALRNPLYRSGYALVVNTAGTTLIGVVYWAVAAHLYSQEAVGRASALVAALMMVSSITQLNLANTLPRFLPSAKRRAGRLIALCYSASSVAAAIGAMAFVVVLPLLSSHWEFVDDSALAGALFIIAVAIWGIFALEDSALTGLGRAVVVPVENTVYGVLKLILLVAIASTMPANGIFFSWVAPLVLCVPVINWLIYTRYLPRRETALQGSEVAGRAVVRHASLDYLGSLFSQAYTYLPPLLVLTALGPVANGYFYIAWTIGLGISGLAANFGTSLLAEGSAAPARLAELTKGVIARCMLVMVPAALLLAVAGRLVLRVYGADYAAHAATILALLAVTTIARSLVYLVLPLDRIAGHVGRAAATQAALAVLAVGGGWIGLKTHGLVGFGMAWLAGHVVVAVARLPRLISSARHHDGRPDDDPVQAATPEPDPEPNPGHAVRHRSSGRHRAAHSPVD